MEKDIAILLATYNGGQYLRIQLDSILSQTFKNWRVFIRDDGSTDDTLKILSEYVLKYPDKFILLKDKRGSLGCRDQFLYLLFTIDSEYYMFCDQDDKWFPDKIEKTYTKLKFLEEKNPNKAIVIGSDSSICGPNLEVINKSCWDHLRIDPKLFLTKEGIMVYPFITGASMIMNSKVKELVSQNPIPPNTPPNTPMYDWWVVMLVYQFGLIDLIDEPTRFYRQHSSNVSGGIEILDTSYLSKLRRIQKVWHSNQMRIRVLKSLNYGTSFKYWFYKLIFLLKMFKYKHKQK